ncbi:hypothetical protein R50073_06770 [Maricurvus nonylphenolicus]|uniref:PDC sensor domain-containing protein n=1 Tax=Maricurvus nonylphenolicus TaxID=1008307 RepID=UPI0036F42FA5
MTRLHKNTLWGLAACVGILVSLQLSLQLQAAEQVKWNQEKLKSILLTEVARLGRVASNEVLVNAVAKQNAEKLTLETITARDKTWTTTDSSDSFKQAMLASEAGTFLQNLISSTGSYTEAFITDNQGANVATYPLTSDYWQGDEDKFIKAFSGKTGNVYIGNMEWDESSQFNAVQISVPVLENGDAIGVMVVGVKLSHVLAKQLEELL